MSDELQAAGGIAAALAASAGILLPGRRARAAGVLLALALALALVLGQAWDELEPVREEGAVFVLGCAASAGLLAGLAAGIRRWPLALPLLALAALPIRVPIEVSGEEANLLLPLYAVIGAGALAAGWEAMARGGRRDGAEPRPLLWALAAATVLYAAQAAYSEDMGFAARNIGFFLIPFAAMFSLLADVDWNPRVLRLGFGVLVAEAVLFALVGIVQHEVGEIFWNPALEASNDFHFYFRVNSLFWDPNIYGRYLALALVVMAAAAMWMRQSSSIVAIAGLGALVLLGLAFSFSQTSLISLLAGIAALCALRWSLVWTAIAVPFAAVAVMAAVIVIGGTSDAEDDPSEISSGRTTLIDGGIELAEEKPLTGHGSASFSVAFAEQEDINPKEPAISHNEPVTVAAEQGAVGLVAYLALIAAAFWALLRGMRGVAPGLGAPRDGPHAPATDGEGIRPLARVALLGAFSALLVHTVGYAGYLTDPLSWALLALAASLAGAFPRAAAPDSPGR